MLRTKYLWLIHLAVCLVAAGVCLAYISQLFFAIVLAVQWLEATLTVSILLTLLTLIPGRPITRAVPQVTVWVAGLALSGLTAYWAEAALDPLLNIGSASFSWSFYLWCAPLLGLYLLGTAVHRLLQRRRNNRTLDQHTAARDPLRIG